MDAKTKSSDNDKEYDYLKTFEMLSCLSDEQLQRVHKHARPIRLGKDQSLFNQGDAVNSFYLVLDGRIKLSRVSAKGEEKIIDIVTEGQMFAEALMFMEKAQYPVNASAISKSEVIGVDADDFTAMLRESIDTCFLLLGNMSFRLHSLIHEIDTLSLHTGTCRVASYIMENSPLGTDNFTLTVPKSVIASRLSVKPETFSRILKELHQKGVLSVDGSNVTIHDRDALTELCINSSCAS